MKKHRLILIGLCIVLIVVSGCNYHLGDWDSESCRIAGYEKPKMNSFDNIVKCRDKCGSLEVGIHYKKLEVLRLFPDTEIQVDYIKNITKECCKEECFKCCEC